MRFNANLFTLLAVFFILADAAYTIWNGVESNWQRVEWVGTAGIAMTAVFAFFLQFYMRLSLRSVGGTLPEDRPDADIDDGEAEQGHFSPWSWWPLFLSFGLGLMFLGLAIGVWIAIIGGPIVLIGAIGWNFEYYRGNFGR